MPFATKPGIIGKIYVPEKSCRTPSKHPCTDCFSCQLCSDERCRVCRGGSSENKGCQKGPSVPSRIDDRHQKPR